MAGAGAGPYSHLHVGMMLKHFKSGRCGVVLGWGDHNGVPYVHLYFADREPRQKTADRSKCYEWRRLSAFVHMNEMRMSSSPHDPECDEHDGKQGAASASSTNVEVDMAKADNIALADVDFIMVDETPKEEMKNEEMKNGELKMHRMDTILEANGE